MLSLIQTGLATLILLAIPSPVLSDQAVTLSIPPQIIEETQPIAPLAATTSIADLIAQKSFAAGYSSSTVKHIQAIAKCESNYRQFNDDGTLYVGEVNPHDVGVFQINLDAHSAKAVKSIFGFDLFSLDGNIDYALKLFSWQGSRPWNPSRPCWSKPIPGW